MTQLIFSSELAEEILWLSCKCIEYSEPLQTLATGELCPSRLRLSSSSLIIFPIASFSLNPPSANPSADLIEPAIRYPELSSNSNGVIGPGLPKGSNLGLMGFDPGADTAGEEVTDACIIRACSIISLWYFCNFRLISEDRL